MSWAVGKGYIVYLKRVIYHVSTKKYVLLQNVAPEVVRKKYSSYSGIKSDHCLFQ